MDAKEFFKEAVRLCDSDDVMNMDKEMKEDLWTLLDLGADEGRFKNGYDELIDYVEKWSKDHPLKTRQEALLKRFPYQRLDADGLSMICPVNFDTRARFAHCNGNCAECRKEYWTSPADEEDQDE